MLYLFITLDCNNVEHEFGKIKNSDSSPLCFTLLRPPISFKNLRKRHNFCKYNEQMVSTLSRWWLRTSRIQKTNRNSLKGLDMEVTVSTDVAEHKKAGIKHNCSQTNKFWFTEFRLQFRSFLPTEKFTSSATKHSGRKLKGCYREFLPIQHILRCYWPGSYALRGVIDHCICFRWGLPFFSWLFSDASFDPDANFGSN